MTQTTESASLRYAALEQWSSTELVQGIVEGQFVAIGAVQAAAPLLAEAIDRIAERLRQGGRLIYMGAGTSGRIAVQDAVELPPPSTGRRRGSSPSWPADRAQSVPPTRPPRIARTSRSPASTL